jgi:pimeloyl-ACP methyl ester carboxylesterase
VLTPLLNRLLYFPVRTIAETPGIEFSDLAIETGDGERLHGWWLPAAEPAVGHVLFLHGNAGNIGDRVPHFELLVAAGLDVLAFDYRGYGRSSGRPSEPGTYADASAALGALLARPGVDPARVVYVGESLGGAVALELAVRSPPAGLVLQSTFTSIRDLARLHYRIVPRALVPDAYPSLRLIPDVRARLLCLHGDRDEIVPLMYGEALFEAARCEKEMVVFPGVAHNDVIAHAGRRWAEAIARFARGER